MASLDSAETQASVVPARLFHWLGEAVENEDQGRSIALVCHPTGLTVPHIQRYILCPMYFVGMDSGDFDPKR